MRTQTTTVPAGIKSVALEATIFRANGDVEPLGTIASWHRNPFVRFVRRLRHHGRLTFEGI